MTTSSPRRGPLRLSVVLGVVLAVLVLAAGVAYAATQHRTYTAETTLVVLPRDAADEATTAAFYETLSRGQIVGTYAEVAGNGTFPTQVMDRLGLTAAQRAAVSTEVTVVPDTSVILVRVTAGQAGLAEQVADGTAGLATTYLGTLSDAFRTTVAHGAAGSAVASGLSRPLIIGLAAAVAVVLGVALQQLVYQLGAARRLTVDADPVDAPPAPVVPAPSREPARAGLTS